MTQGNSSHIDYEKLVVPIDDFIRAARRDLVEAEWECADDRIPGLRLDLDHALALIERGEQFLVKF